MISKVQKLLASSRLLTKLALKVRNQCNAVLACRIGKENDGAQSGEYWFIEQYLSPDAECVIDVGANRGDWASAIHRSSSDGVEIHCYEPDPRVESDFKSSFDQSRKVHFYGVAVGSKKGELDIFLDQQSTELTSVVESGRDQYRTTVDVTTLDDESERHQLRYIDLLKIDTEGYEEAVLRGASALLHEEKIGCIQFEYGKKWVKTSATLQVVSFLESYNFEVFILRPDSLQRVDFDMIGEYFSYSNYIAVHKKNRNRIENLISKHKFLK